MKKPILRGLQALGLAPIGHVYEARARLTEGEVIVRDLRAKVDQLTREATAYRDEIGRLRTDAERVDARSAEQREAMTAEVRAARADAAEWKTRAEQLVVQFRELRQRVSEAERIEGQLRELLMVNEAKLDLVEAAINLLDVRTRGEGVPRA
jgi:hypothetical protein